MGVDARVVRSTSQWSLVLRVLESSVIPPVGCSGSEASEGEVLSNQILCALGKRSELFHAEPGLQSGGLGTSSGGEILSPLSSTAPGACATCCSESGA